LQLDDEYFIRLALIEAERAGALGEVPVGAVVVCQGVVVASAHNTRISDCDPTAHAEIAALRKAGVALGRWNLYDCDIYVTLEPCVMCTGALANARIRTLYYGATDNRYGGISMHDIINNQASNHKIAIKGGVLASECAAILSEFFAKIRKG
jgi:tRNA(adenine34) deaminase